MGLLKLAAALALMAGSLGFSATASAQRHDDRRIERTDRRGDVRRGDVRRGDVRRAQVRRAEVRRAQVRRDRMRRDDRRYQRRDVRRGGYGRNCKMIWRNHRRVRVCR